MEPQRALAILDGIAAKTAATRQEHVVIQQAVQVLSAIIATPIPVEKTAPTKSRKTTSTKK